MTTKEALDRLFEEHLSAIEFCDKVGRDKGFGAFAKDRASCDEKFLMDAMMLATVPICADGEFSETERARYNDVFDAFGYGLSIVGARYLLSKLGEDTFEVPRTLIPITLRSKLKIFTANSRTRAVVLREELAYLDQIMYLYACVMCSMADQIGQKEKDTILRGLGLCCEYISDDLRVHYTLSANVRQLIDEAAI